MHFFGKTTAYKCKMFFIARHSKKFKLKQFNLGHIITYNILLHLRWLSRLTGLPLAPVYPDYYE